MITREDVQELLQSMADDPTLVLLEGRVLVISASELGSGGPYNGALEIISRTDLIAQSGADTEPDYDLDSLASRLDTLVTEWGA